MFGRICTQGRVEFATAAELWLMYEICGDLQIFGFFLVKGWGACEFLGVEYDLTSPYSITSAVGV